MAIRPIGETPFVQPAGDRPNIESGGQAFKPPQAKDLPRTTHQIAESAKPPMKAAVNKMITGHKLPVDQAGLLHILAKALGHQPE